MILVVGVCVRVCVCACIREYQRVTYRFSAFHDLP